MKTIIPHFWFDKQAVEAAEFYTSLLPNSTVINTARIHNTPSGDCDIVTFTLAGQTFMAISAGPVFSFNPSISFHINCKTVEDVNQLWEKLKVGGTILMDLGEYPFSKRFGWLNDKYGLSWQIIYAGERPIHQTITPALTFVGRVVGCAEEAMKLYTSVFAEKTGVAHSKIITTTRYGNTGGPDKEGTIQLASFMLGGLEFVAMDSAYDHQFAFNEAVSLIIPCDTQKEIDYFWEKLSADPKAEQCGWLKDKFGVSWQVWPAVIGEMMRQGTQAQIDRVTQAFLPMKKFDIATLEKAFNAT